MMHAFELKSVTKRYEPFTGMFTDALKDVTVAVPKRSIVGLIGRNGSGKSTLLRHVTGLVLPTSGEVVTLGAPADRLGRAELSRIGVLDQNATLIEWMSARQLVRYVSSFYEMWDRALESELMTALDVPADARVGAMSPGNVQRLALVLAVCHHPEIVLLDEPLSDLDPISRQTVLLLLLDRFSSDDATIVISSHMLRDIEPVVNRVVCMNAGQVVADDEIDGLRERFAEWIVTSPEGRLPASYDEAYIVAVQGSGGRARLGVRDGAAHVRAFAERYGADVEVRPLALEQIFPLLVGPPVVTAAAAQEVAA